MNKLYTFIGTFFAIISGFIGFFLFGKKSGKEQEQQKNIKAELEVAHEFKKDNDVIANNSDDTLRNELYKDARN